MSFRKKNISITPSRGPPPASTPSSNVATSTTSPTLIPPGSHQGTTPTSIPEKISSNLPVPTAPMPGVRPSPLTGHPTTSTGTSSLDALMAGHAGIPLGTSILIGEPGTTDFGGALLRYFAAEGIVQGHHVIIVGMGEGWARELPAAVGGVPAAEEGVVEGEKKVEKERMRIAWRYERLAAGATGALGRPERGASSDDGVVGGRQSGEEAALGQDCATSASTQSKGAQTQAPFCHSFDLTKRLEIPSGAKITFIPLLPPPLPSTSASTSAQPPSPFLPIVQKLHSILTASAQSHTPTIHRLLIPSLLCPPLYPPHSSLPRHTLQFLHTLRALLRRHPATLTAMLSLPLKLHPRDTGLVRWAEHLCDAVIELVPLPSLMEKASAAAAKGRDDIPMGLVRIWKVPGGTGVLGGRGAAAAAEVMGEDLAFTMTRKRFGIMRYSLPPAEGEEGESGNGGGSGGRSGGTKGAEGGGGKTTKVDIEF